MTLREEIAKAVYELDPCYEGGGCVDGFQVSPGGNLSWEQAKDRDAEFGGLTGFIAITEPSYQVADAILARVHFHQKDVIRMAFAMGAIAGAFVQTLIIWYWGFS